MAAAGAAANPTGRPVPPSLDNKVQVTQRFPYRRPTPLSF